MSVLDQVLVGDCLAILPTLPDGLASLVFTSPPYNVGMEYGAGDGERDGDLSLDAWLDWLDRVWRECARVLRPGGHLVVNLPCGVSRTPFVPVSAPAAVRIQAIPGGRLVGAIVWRKAGESFNGDDARSSSTAWGSWLSPSAPSLRDVHEDLIPWRKDGGPLTPHVTGAVPDIDKATFIQAISSVWSIQTVASEGGHRWHPAAFPVELAVRAIRLWTYPGDVVLDPFGGSGTVGVAARMLGRRYVLCELDPTFARRAQERIDAAGMQSALPWGSEKVRG